MSKDKAEVIEGLRRNKEKYGQPYCPCIPSYLYGREDAADFICPCKAWREENVCICGLHD